MFKKMPFVLLVLIVGLGLSHDYIPLTIQQNLYAVSLLIKSGISMILPFIIFSLLFKTMASLADRASGAIIVVLAAVCLSNFISTHTSHFLGQWVYNFDMCLIQPGADSVLLNPAWEYTFPTLIPNSWALFFGIFSGLLSGWIANEQSIKISKVLDAFVAQFLKILIAVIPVFICGYVLKMLHDGILDKIIRDYSTILLIIAGAQFSYIILLYFIGASLHVQTAIDRIKNMIPAMFTGFTTMSSAAAMPLTLLGTEKNTQNKDMGRAVIPATVNIHLVGDCFAIPIFAFAVMKNYGVSAPDFMTYLIFSGYFVITKFSVAAIPGGGIIVMIPILEQYLGFNAEMTSLITALYILFDPVITSANVFGNGAFACLTDRFFAQKKTCLEV